MDNLKARKDGLQGKGAHRKHCMLGAVVGLSLASRTWPLQHARNCSRQLETHRKEGPQLRLRL